MSEAVDKLREAAEREQQIRQSVTEAADKVAQDREQRQPIPEHEAKQPSE